MLGLSEELRFYLFTGKVNFRMGCISLCEVIRTQMNASPEDERSVFVFMNASRTIVRIIHYERGFYVMYEKRPGKGRFRKPVYDSRSGKYKISYTDLVCLTEGLVRTEVRLPEIDSETSTS